MAELIHKGYTLNISEEERHLLAVVLGALSNSDYRDMDIDPDDNLGSDLYKLVTVKGYVADV